MRRAGLALVPFLLAHAAFAADGLEFRDAKGVLKVRAVAADIVRFDYVPVGASDGPTEIIDPRGLHRARGTGTVEDGEILTGDLRVTSTPSEVIIRSRAGDTLLRIDRGAVSQGMFVVKHPKRDDLYGMRGYGLGNSRDPKLARSNGLTRNLGAHVSGSAQGDGGSPLAYTTTWGLFVDSIDGDFANADGALQFSHGSRKSIEAYVVVGPPKRTIQMSTDLTGHPPMFPKWAMGFMNSQWKTDETEITSIIDTYRAKQIPIDSFIMDFDFKAWGEDDFGEFRWNSTNGPGNVGAMKFPNGQNGGFGKLMASKGIHLVGIMKPRVLVENTEHKPSKVALEANAHGWWMPGKKPYTDYFSHRLANDFDFSNPDLRKWYWKYAKNLFDTGIEGWWNDEADDGFDSLGFYHMQQSLYEGQRRDSKLRVWSLNRNFYEGAQKFAFGTWSGDIGTGFNVMQDQRIRMLTILDLGQPHWSMDTGGFGGHPSPENYARWMEFAAVVPIMRVHSTFGEHRQPWVYGPVAEAAAVKAIKLRYSLFPFYYSLEREASRTGVGIVRPMFWEFPNDPLCSNNEDDWMLGGSLLVSPVAKEGQAEKGVYLPEGTWYDYWTGREFRGGQAVNVSLDSTGWSDLPMFVRSGSIVATQPVVQHMGEKPIEEITLDIWPDANRRASFEVYDDDGATYAYEKGAFFSQKVSADRKGTGTTVRFDRPTGSFGTTIRSYRIRLHSVAGSGTWNGKPIQSDFNAGVSVLTVPSGRKGELRFGS